MELKPLRIFLLLVPAVALLCLVCLQPIMGQGSSRGGERGSYMVNWDGVWETTYGKMVLAQDGSKVRGTYNGVVGRIDANARGNVLDFEWSEIPDRSDPGMHGPGEFIMRGSAGSFEGWWESESYAEHAEWVGTRAGDRQISGSRAPVEYCLWRGSWETADGAIFFGQSIDSPEVSGEFISGMSYGEFEGEASGWSLDFTWSDDDGAGEGTFEMSGDLAGFVGHFVSGEESDETMGAGEFRSSGIREDFSGTWSTDFGEMIVSHDPESGTALGSIGRFLLIGRIGECSIAGRTVGNCCLFTWSLSGTSGEESGHGVIRLDKKGDDFDGVWSFDDPDTDDRNWSGFRLRD